MDDVKADAMVLPDMLSLADPATHRFDPDEPLQPVDNPLQGDGLIVTTRAAVADMIATAVAAAGVAQQRTGATTATIRAAALDAITPVAAGDGTMPTVTKETTR